jgi:hypothetical protein
MHASRNLGANTVARALVAGSLASLASVIVLGICARREGHAAPQPLNATGHWVHGDAASRRTSIDTQHTGLGFATHHAAALMWGFLFESLRTRSNQHGVRTVLGDAALTSSIAALVDYGLTPHRFTPGWELVLSKRSMAAAYFGMSAGFAAAELLLPRRAGPTVGTSDSKH